MPERIYVRQQEVLISTPRIALVGGGASGIGRASADALARAGDHVVITGRSRDTLDAAAQDIRASTGGQVEVLVSDIGDPESGPAAVTETARRFGGPDVLVLNAGGPPPGRILDVDDAQWQHAFDLLVRGPLRLARLALPMMAERGFGRVILVTSTAVRQPQRDLATSVVLRSAATAAAKLLAAEFAADGVTVNCVAPGPIATPRRAAILNSRAERTGTSVDILDAEDTAGVPAGRSGRPGEVAAAVAFLASAEASYLNGTVVTVDGGRTETI